MEHARPRTLTDRMVGAAMLRNEVYEEVEADGRANGQAALVVALVAVAAAVGGVGGGTGGIVTGILSAYIGWLLWSGVTYLIGTKLLGGTATWSELLRTIGFAQSPGVLYVIGVIPLLGWLANLVVAFWVLIAVIVAIRQALDFRTGRAILTSLIGFIPYLILRGLVTWLIRV